MRRAQSLRNHTTAHLRTASSPGTDDLGILREQPEDSAEDTLRRQLLECQRENDKLRAQILALQDQLNLRPPLEKIQELQKEYKNLEILLLATQRENEKCMGEVERGKAREKMLERELARLAGDNWQSALNITANTSTILRAPMLSNPRLGDTSAIYLPGVDAPDTSHVLNTSRGQDHSGNSSSSALLSETDLLAHIQQIRTVLLSIEQNNEARETRLTEMLERAEGETKKFEAIKRDVDSKGFSVGVA